MSVQFRPARLEDREPILAICRRIWEGSDFVPHVLDRWLPMPDHYFAVIEEDGDVAGCGRLLPMSPRIAWLEALRIAPDRQKRGLGRRLAYHLFDEARRRGFPELWFSTYFRNADSIRISEDAGFERLAVWSLLELSFERCPDARARAIASPAPGDVEVTPGIPPTSSYLTSDWMFVPPAVPDRERFLMDPVTIRSGGCRLVAAVNGKFPEATIDIALVEAPEGDDGRRCLAEVARHAAESGRKTIQAMIPPGASPEAFLEAGFTSYQQLEDIYLYRAYAASLRLSTR